MATSNTRIAVLPLGHESLPAETTYALADADQVMPGIHTIISIVLAHPSKLTKEQLSSNLAKGLANLFRYIPMLAGQLEQAEGGRVSVVRKNHEEFQLNIAHLEENPAVGSLEDFIADHFINFLPAEQLLPHDANVRGVRRETGCPVSVFQVCFVRGGLVLTAAISHLVADAKTIDHAFAIWAASSNAACNDQQAPAFELSFNKTYFNTPALPNADELASIVKELQGFSVVPIAEFEGMKVSKEPAMEELEKTTTDQSYHFSSKTIQRLKDAGKPTKTEEFVSTVDVVVAATWRAMTRARLPFLQPGPDGGESQTSMAFPVDTRGRFDVVPDKYIGNGFAMAVTKPVSVPDLLGPNGLATGALAIRHGVQSIKATTVPDLMRTGAALMGQGKRLKWNYDPNGVVSTSWTKLRVFTHYDFGFGMPVAVLRESPAGFTATMTITPPVRVNDEADGVDVFVTIETRAAKALENDAEFQSLAKRLLPRSK